MKTEQTLSIVKPDAVAAGHMGNIMQHFEDHGLKIVAAQLIHMTEEQAKGFYAVHSHRPFFGELVQFMISGPVMVMVLQGPNAVLKNRELMGATDPAKADKGTIRSKYGASIGENAVHGSDSLENARNEIDYFFTAHDLVAR